MKKKFSASTEFDEMIFTDFKEKRILSAMPDLFSSGCFADNAERQVRWLMLKDFMLEVHFCVHWLLELLKYKKTITSSDTWASFWISGSNFCN